MFYSMLMACKSTGKDRQMSMPVVFSDTLAADTSAQSTTGHGGSADAMADTLTVALTGDIMMGTTYPAVMLPADSGKRLFRHVAYILRSADLAVGNLEGTLSDDTVDTSKQKNAHSYSFRTPTSYGARLKEAGYDFLSMANNHSFDFGIEGVRSSERTLRANGIAYAGIAGRTEVAVVERGGVRYGICAFGHNHYTVMHMRHDYAKTLLDSLARISDVVVVSFHGGAEGRSKNRLPYGKETFLGEDRGSLRDFAHFCIDNGADIVYGHGPHVVRCVEVYKDRFIAYSLGNFCTPYGISVAGTSGYAPVVRVNMLPDGTFVSGKVHSFIQRRGVGPCADTLNIVASEMKRLTELDVTGSPVRMDKLGNISRKE